MSLADVPGQEFAVLSLRNAIRSGKVATAYLFHGPQGVGKRTTALAFAKALNCAQQLDDACDACSTCRRIDRGVHPDVTLVGLLPGKTRLLIEQIKEIEHKLVFAPFEARRRVFIIDEADFMSPEATGAILKTLEEPPEQTVFVLIAENQAMLPPTIISRCQSLRFSPLKAEAIRSLLEKRGMPPAASRLASRLAQGSMERALSIGQGDFLERRHRLVELYFSTSPNDIGALCGAAAELVGEKGRHAEGKERRRRKLDDILEIMLGWCRDILVARCGGPQGLFVNEDLSEEIRKESSRLSHEQAQELVKAALEAFRRAERNVLPEACIEAMFLRLSAVRSGSQSPS